jgi:2-hydroxy-3-oxopropionate reductase
LAETATADSLVIDMSSIAPQATRDLAADFRLRTGGGFVDAPLSGGAPGARAGRLTVMAGGSDGDLARARTVLAPLCANFTAMGPSGAGQATKLVNQILCAIGFVAVAEAVKFAEDSGVDAALIPQALAGGRADSRILQEFMGKMSRRDYTPTGRIDNMLKDLEAVQSVALRTRTPMPVTGLVADLHRLLVAMGHGAADTAALMALFEPTTPQN